MKHRLVASAICSIVVGFSAPMSTASGQGYPTKPIRMVTAFSGGSEIVIRMIADKMSGVLGQSVVVEPMSAASGVLAAGVVARAAPDGYTLLVGNSTTHVLKPVTLKAVSYDPVKDFSPITNLTVPTFVLGVRADLGIADVPSLLERSKKTRTLLGGNGVGATAHVSMLALNKTGGGSLQFVPYKDDGGSVLALLSGDIEAAITVGSAMTRVLQDEVNAKKIRVIGLFNNGPRPSFENVRTVAEQVPGFRELNSFTGVWGPAGMPPDIVARLNKVIGEVAQEAATRERVITMGSMAVTSTPEQLGNTVRDELPKVRALLKKAGIEPE